MVYIKFSLRS